MPAAPRLTLAAAALAVLLASGCSRENTPQIRLTSPDTSACKLLLAEPGYKDCSLILEFGPVGPGAGPTRRAAAEAWLAAHASPAVQVRTQEGAKGSARICMVEPFDRDTDAAYVGLKPITETSAAGLMRLCTNTGRSIRATDPVDRGDEVRR